MNAILEETYFEYYRFKAAIVGKGRYFTFFMETMKTAFQAKGIETELFRDIDEAENWGASCIIVVNPVQFRIVSPVKADTMLIGIQTEQLPTPETGPLYFGGINLAKLRRNIGAYDALFEFSESNFGVLKKYARKRTTLKMLPSPFFLSDAPADAAECGKEYDLLFVGSWIGDGDVPYARRGVILEALQRRYNVYPKMKNLWGDEKDEAIRKSKICLNIHHDEGRYVETARMAEYFSRNAFLLSERSAQSVFVDGEDYASFDLFDIFDKIDYYLAHEEERARIAKNARAKLDGLTMEKNAAAILDTVIMIRYKQHMKRKGWQKEIDKIVRHERLAGWKHTAIRRLKGLIHK